jgi:hypothetical protein
VEVGAEEIDKMLYDRGGTWNIVTGVRWKNRYIALLTSLFTIQEPDRRYAAAFGLDERQELPR